MVVSWLAHIMSNPRVTPTRINAHVKPVHVLVWWIAGQQVQIERRKTARDEMITRLIC